MDGFNEIVGVDIAADDGIGKGAMLDIDCECDKTAGGGGGGGFIVSSVTN